MANFYPKINYGRYFLKFEYKMKKTRTTTAGWKRVQAAR